MAENTGTVRVRGLRELQRGLRRVSPDIVKALRSELREIGGVTVRLAQQFAPVGPTGRLSASIRVRPLAKGVLVGSPVIYAPVIEFGKRSQQRSRSGSVYERSLTPQPWLVPAIDETSGQVKTELIPAIERALEAALSAEGVIRVA